MTQEFTLQFTKEQLHELIIQHIKKENGLQDIQETLVHLLLTERTPRSNRCIPSQVLSHDELYTLLLSLLRSQQQKIDHMSDELFLQGKGLEKIASITEKLLAEKCRYRHVSRVDDAGIE